MLGASAILRKQNERARARLAELRAEAARPARPTIIPEADERAADVDPAPEAQAVAEVPEVVEAEPVAEVEADDPPDPPTPAELPVPDAPVAPIVAQIFATPVEFATAPPDPSLEVAVRPALYVPEQYDGVSADRTAQPDEPAVDVEDVAEPRTVPPAADPEHDAALGPAPEDLVAENAPVPADEPVLIDAAAAGVVGGAPDEPTGGEESASGDGESDPSDRQDPDEPVGVDPAAAVGDESPDSDEFTHGFLRDVQTLIAASAATDLDAASAANEQLAALNAPGMSRRERKREQKRIKALAEQGVAEEPAATPDPVEPDPVEPEPLETVEPEAAVETDAPVESFEPADDVAPPLSRRERKRRAKELAAAVALAEPEVEEPVLEPVAEITADPAEKPARTHGRGKRQRARDAKARAAEAAELAALAEAVPDEAPSSRKQRRAERAASRAEAGDTPPHVPRRRGEPNPKREHPLVRRGVRIGLVVGLIAACAALPWVVPAVPDLLASSVPETAVQRPAVDDDPKVEPPAGFVGPVGVDSSGGPYAGVRLASAGVPLEVDVPRLRVSSDVVPISGQTGELLPPDDPQILGWWQEGRRAGARSGSAVVTGHTVQAGGGAFDNLAELVPGDIIRVRTDAGWIRYVVSRSRIYSVEGLARNAKDIFALRGPGRLVLITCDDFNGEVYLSNAVVFAVPVADQPFEGPPADELPSDTRTDTAAS